MNNTLRAMAIAGATFLASMAIAQESGSAPSYARNQGTQGQQGQPNGNQGPGGQGGKSRHGPPPEAVSACAGKHQDMQCSFVNPRGNTMNGSCRQVPEGKVACVPNDMGGPGAPGGGGRRMQGGNPGGMSPAGN